MCDGNHDHAIPDGEMHVLVLPDGRIRIETGSFAGAAHAAAEAILPALAEAMGITIEDVRSRTTVVHAHVHGHVHVKAGAK